ncbi:MAG: hypothetical protein E6Z06_00720 [Clostridiales bacterium]|uniref:Type II toxin-antitoxin system RelE/ParE family toxin n=1 Tax=Peptococcus niger TaxID=2741 RepID=A0A1G6VMV5_PEPNI|nr:hypothetical protein [Peptococcus niger]MDU5951403.1 hypothetical protein [Clostridiales bacterium]SDD54888.1 hypothetical protein SAMN04489866_10487 [Peptococcus niger]
METVLLDDNRQLAQFLKQQRVSQEVFLQRALVRYRDVVRLHPEKIKTVPGAKHKGAMIFEFKLPFEAYRSFRVAFVRQDRQLRIIFASHEIKKKEFTKALKKTALVD